MRFNMPLFYVFSLINFSNSMSNTFLTNWWVVYTIVSVTTYIVLPGCQSNYKNVQQDVLVNQFFQFLVDW